MHIIKSNCVATTIWSTIYNKESHSCGRKQKVDAQKLQIDKSTVNRQNLYSAKSPSELEALIRSATIERNYEIF